MNFKTLKPYYKFCCTHYMFRPIWPSGVKSYIKIALKTAALFHLCFPASRFRSIVHWYVNNGTRHRQDKNNKKTPNIQVIFIIEF
jgi:hypothetical protein